MTIEELGYTKELEQYRIDNKLQNFEIARVVAEHKERYVVKTNTAELEAEITGNIRFSATSRQHFPAVGDWVSCQVFDEKMAIIHHIFPRFSSISRKAVNQTAEKQLIATNIHFALIVQAVDRDFSINRIERYLTICYQSKVEPIVILTKIDLITNAELQTIELEIRKRIKAVPVITVSNHTQEGIDELKKVIQSRKTYTVLGSSGVGKSSLINTLSEQTIMKTGQISLSTNRGRHVTTHRQLIVLTSGAIFIDNPGMREVGVADSATGVAAAFSNIQELAENCKFKNCSHTVEKGCAVLNALKNNELEEATYLNYLKIEREKTHYEASVAEKRKRDKEFGKMVKRIKKHKSRNKLK